MGDLTFDDSVLSALDENGPAASSGPASPGEGADPPHAGGLHMGKGLQLLPTLLAIAGLGALSLAFTGNTSPRNAEEEEKPTGNLVVKEMALQQKVREHQENAVKLDAATEVQYNHGFAVMSTNSLLVKSASMPGFPGGSVVGFAPDEKGRPLFSFSSMSSHTQDLIKDKRCSLTVAAKEFKGAADGRVNLIGEDNPGQYLKAVPIESEEEIAEAKARLGVDHPVVERRRWFPEVVERRVGTREAFRGVVGRRGTGNDCTYSGTRPEDLDEAASGVPRPEYPFGDYG
ncbi:hypothetical protein AK812_SmicGene26813 [Symbiodinium microadriaticum]|uniref:Uncharacterized protein n=1 Tax=Symbiodinium microadriaticum TaxID=2951 RepID=A0A1Q9D8F9_SYMMI|nr:hypothetical protein AK812_SmicGene26813 [Symbiodinium microadriaticum]